MTDLRTAAQQALEALEESLYATTDKSQFLAFEAITALRAALAEPQEPDPAGEGIAIKWNGAVLYLDGREIYPGVVELRKDGYTYRSAVKVDVQPAKPENPRRKALAQALRGIADGFEQKTYWFRPDPLVMSTLRRAADELDKEEV